MVRSLPALTALGAAVITLLAISEVTAAPKRIAIVGLEIGGDGAPELQAQLAGSVAKGIASASASTIELAEVRAALTESPELLGCISSTCLARLGERLGADGFVRGKVEAEGADYAIELELYNTSELIHRIEKACTVCTIGELNAVVEASAKLLVEGASDSPIHVVIRTEPSASEITIDGLARGLAPFEGPLAPGPHLLVVRAPSGKTVRQRIEVTAAMANQPLVLHIEDPAPVVPPVVATERSFGSWKWAAAGGSLSSLALGATLLIVDGRGTCGDPDRECPRVYKTQTAGVLALAAGAGLAGVAGYMFWRDAKERTSVSPAVDIAPGVTLVGLSGSF